MIPGLGDQRNTWLVDFADVDVGGEGAWRVGSDGVERILAPLDRSVEFVIFREKTLVHVNSRMGHPATYRLDDCTFEAPAKAVLMDLDGTSVKSEEFWVWTLERAIGDLRQDGAFRFEQEDAAHVSGRSISEHLAYCVGKYCMGATVDDARRKYYRIMRRELQELAAGRGRMDAIHPAPGLKKFLLALKQAGVRIALVTSGLYEKAWPQIVAVFRQLELGDPLGFYDAIVTAGSAVEPGQVGTIGELASKPHPWLYAEAARIGLTVDRSNRQRVIGIEDSAAGVLAIRLAGFACIGLTFGNIAASGMRPLVAHECDSLEQALPTILGEDP